MREAHAARRTTVETHRSKRVIIGDGPSVTVTEKVPTYVAERPLSIDKDPSIFVMTWDLQRKDSVAGSSKAAAIWSESVITERDGVEIVEFSDDLQIKRLGTQALTSVSFPTLICCIRSLIVSFV